MEKGVRAFPIEELQGLHLRICRPVGLSSQDAHQVATRVLGRLGDRYDLKNVFDLARYLLPTPPVPTPWRRPMLALGSSDPTRAICSTLIAEAFETVGFPILPIVGSKAAAALGCPDREVMRRASLGVFGGVALACASATGSALALTRPVGGIHVDVAPLRENAGDPTAAWVAQAMPGALAQALAEVGRPGAPVSVRIDYVILGPNTGNAGGPAGSSPDQMVGVVIVGGVARPLRALTSYYPAASDPATIEQSNYDRVFQLSRAFAYWAARGYSGT